MTTGMTWEETFDDNIRKTNEAVKPSIEEFADRVREKADRLSDEIGRDHPHNKQYDAGRFFQHPDNFARDVSFVSRRARVLSWAYNCLYLDQPYHVMNLGELASIAFELIERDMRSAAKMADEVSDQQTEVQDDLNCTRREFKIALEWLLLQRHLAGRYRRMYRAAAIKSGASKERADQWVAGVEKDATAYGAHPASFEALRDEIAEEDLRREQASDAAADAMAAA